MYNNIAIVRRLSATRNVPEPRNEKTCIALVIAGEASRWIAARTTSSNVCVSDSSISSASQPNNNRAAAATTMLPMRKKPSSTFLGSVTGSP